MATVTHNLQNTVSLGGKRCGSAVDEASASQVGPEFNSMSNHVTTIKLLFTYLLALSNKRNVEDDI